jgi:Tol biopolymer transport system component
LSRDGKTAPLRAMPSNWADPRFSADGMKLAFDIVAVIRTDLWVYDLTRHTATRLPFDGTTRTPVWTPDSNRIAFAAAPAGRIQQGLYWQRADGTGGVQQLTDLSSQTPIPSSFHPSGKYLAFSQTTNNGGDLMILPLEGDENSGWKPGKPSVFLSTPANERKPMFSRDGRWIAYVSDENGQADVFVRQFPGGGRKVQISPNGGLDPTFSQTRNELLYRGSDKHIMVVPYTVEGDSFKPDKPRIWSEQMISARVGQNSYDLHPDGERLAAGLPTGQAEEKLDKVTFIFNFFDELHRIAPVSKK